MATKIKWTKPVFCEHCYTYKTPAHTQVVREFLVNGFWVTVGVPSMKVLCSTCQQWIPNNSIKDYLGKYYGKGDFHG